MKSMKPMLPLSSLLLTSALLGFVLYGTVLLDWIHTIRWGSFAYQPAWLLSKTAFLVLYTGLAVKFGVSKITSLLRR